MAAQEIGGLWNTKQPGYEDSADIQAALKLFLYGDYEYNTTSTNTTQIPNPSLARHLQDLRDDVTFLEGQGIGSDHLTLSQISAISSPTDGFIAMASDSSGSAVLTSYATTVFTDDAPTENLTNGMIWIDKNSSPLKSYVYDSATSSFIPMNELENTIDNPGDLLYGSADNVLAKLPIGTTGQILKVSSGLPAWQNDKVWTLKSSGNLTGASSFTCTGISGDKFYIVLKDWSHNDITDVTMVGIRFNGDSGPNYLNTGGVISSSSLHSPTFADDITHNMTIMVDLSNTAAALKPVSTIAKSYQSGVQYFGYYKNVNPITSVQVFLSPSGQFDEGSYQVWSYE